MEILRGEREWGILPSDAGCEKWGNRVIIEACITTHGEKNERMISIINVYVSGLYY